MRDKIIIICLIAVILLIVSGYLVYFISQKEGDITLSRLIQEIIKREPEELPETFEMPLFVDGILEKTENGLLYIRQENTEDASLIEFNDLLIVKEFFLKETVSKEDELKLEIVETKDIQLSDLKVGDNVSAVISGEGETEWLASEVRRMTIVTGD